MLKTNIALRTKKHSPLRPNGSFLSTRAGRYLVGKEVLLLMGMPIHRYDTTMLTNREAFQK